MRVAPNISAAPDEASLAGLPEGEWHEAINSLTRFCQPGLMRQFTSPPPPLDQTHQLPPPSHPHGLKPAKNCIVPAGTS